MTDADEAIKELGQHITPLHLRNKIQLLFLGRSRSESGAYLAAFDKMSADAQEWQEYRRRLDNRVGCGLKAELE